MPATLVHKKVGLVKNENAFDDMNVITSPLSTHRKINKVIIKLFPENRKSTIVIGSFAYPFRREKLGFITCICKGYRLH